MRRSGWLRFQRKHLEGFRKLILWNDDLDGLIWLRTRVGLRRGFEDAFLGAEIINEAGLVIRRGLPRNHSYSPTAYSAPIVDVQRAVSPDDVSERATLAVTSHVACAFHLTPARATTPDTRRREAYSAGRVMMARHCRRAGTRARLGGWRTVFWLLPNLAPRRDHSLSIRSRRCR